MTYIDPLKDNIECDKITYPNLKDAMKAVKPVSKKNKQSFYPYKCSDCGLYHLATAGKRKYKRHKPVKNHVEEMTVHIETGKRTKAGNQQVKEIQVKVKK